jgi:hypothetical protein
MPYGLLADVVVVLHFGFVLFVVFGGLLALRWRRAVWLHLPAAVWGALIEFTDWICPLTPLEHWLWRQGGQAGYQGGFVEHYILPVLYPHGLTRTIQLILGLLVIGINLLVYAILWRRRQAGATASTSTT